MGPERPPERSPDLELPEDQYPFQECIDITDMGIAGFKLESDILANQFRSQSYPEKNEEGPIAFADAAETYQPRNNGYQNR